jgi:hypothetical protein
LIKPKSYPRKVIMIDQKTLEAFNTSLRGQLIQPGDEEYAEACKVYNGMIDRRPGMVVRCLNVADVMASVNFARENGQLVAIRGGGHNGPGLGTCDGGVVIDLSSINYTRVDPKAQTVQVGGGSTWGDVDHATHAFGLAVPSGIVSTTGVGGLTLGGGHGYLTQKYGLTIDNLLGADMVLADGSFISVSAEENQDLFWAIRGGGGNFGVVTEFRFQAHPVHTIVGGPTLWHQEQTTEVMRWFRDFMGQAPEDLYGFFAILIVPPGPPFPDELHLKKMCGVVWCYTGPEEDAEKVFQPIKEFGPPAMYGIQSMPFPALQGAFDPLYPPGLHWYWKGDFVNELTDEAIDLHVKHGFEMPSWQSTMHLYPIGGKPNEIGPEKTPWGHRQAKWSEVIVGVDSDPKNTEAITEWARKYWEALHPHSAGGAYVNFMMEEGEDRVKATYGSNYDRLAAIKQYYDSTNLFRINQNIKPGG